MGVSWIDEPETTDLVSGLLIFAAPVRVQPAGQKRVDELPSAASCMRTPHASDVQASQMPPPRVPPQLRRSARNISIKAVVQAELGNAGRGKGPTSTAEPVKRARSSTKTESPVSKKVKLEPASPVRRQLSPTSGPKRVKVMDEIAKAEVLKDRKLKSFAAFARKSPFPELLRPTAEECKVAHGILARLHGERLRPEAVVAPTNSAGCGDAPSVLDALVRTILSQNTNNRNSSRAKLSMDKEYGGSDKWEDIVRGGQARLQKSIQSGGLAATKSKVIMGVLRQTKDKYGVYSLDHLFQASDEEAMKEMLSFQGVGPKTASCVLLFCLQRPSFAVDTHVYRLAGLLGWRPSTAGREETQAHLDAMVPDEEKYPLHLLMVTHGQRCEECKAGGRSAGKCELRRVFRGGRFMAGAQEEEEDVGEVDAVVKSEEHDAMVKSEEHDAVVKKEDE
ncbi:hypothetical protein E4U42_007383 [Claviceps africana]|uniref:HhH-GPD domain-containing protein n=1 Tax=Claviceps africana TaxID=83212 RepID=A0A8K0J1T8_9HYPO|nr:hypothetical protein E4U42_007383 [Claviceps africana]